MAKTKTTKKKSSSIGFEEKLWQAADKLRSIMDAAEYKRVVRMRDVMRNRLNHPGVGS